MLKAKKYGCHTPVHTCNGF